MPAKSRAVFAACGCGPERTVSAALAHVLLMVGVKRGLDPDEFCAATSIQIADLADRDRQVPYAWFVALVRVLAARAPRASLATEVAQFAALEQFGYLGQALKHASTPLASLALLMKYSRLIDSASQGRGLALELHGGALHVVVPDVSTEEPEWAEALLVGMVAVVRAVCPREIKPLEVRFARRTATLPCQLDAFFDAPVSFAHTDNRLLLDAALLELPTRCADPDSCLQFCAQVDKLLQQLDEPFVTLVHRAIATQLVRGDLSQQGVGRCLALSTRSLQRKLNQHGLKYTTLVHETRTSVAARLLLDPARSIGEIASAVGYQDLSSFARMFRRGTGLSPRTFRRKQRAVEGFRAG